jgi:tRNA-dihydrouridine synthase C
MLGRGAIADPLLARKLRGEATGGWAEVAPGVATPTGWACAGRWCRCMPAAASSNGWPCCAATIPEAEVLYQRLRPIKAAEDIDAPLVDAGILD